MEAPAGVGGGVSNPVDLVLGGLAVLSFLLQLWQLLGAVRFRFRSPHPAGSPGPAGPADATEPSAFTPALTLLKPLKGVDETTRECLRSWTRQDYPGARQILFGVASSEDPACVLVRELMAEHPGMDLELVICPERLGVNAKVSQLIQLERKARHEVIVISDADVWAPADFLRRAVAPLRDPQVGLTNCFYRQANEETFGMRWEAFAVNADFWSQVLQSVALKPMDFALGAAMATTRQRLQGIGGFSALKDQLADDYQLGHRIARSGGSLELCPVVVECRSGRLGFGAVWAHQLRWARTIRVCQPGPFFFSILSNATLWPVLWGLVSPGSVSVFVATAFLVFRLGSGAVMERRLAGRTTASRAGMPIWKDLLQAVIWALALLGKTVVWRGVRYQILRNGDLVRLADVDSTP